MRPSLPFSPTGGRRRSSASTVAISPRAFTLVELLVVIGIIALLISILIPTLGRAQQSARSTACMSNLRQLGNAIQIYAVNNKQSLPLGYWDGKGADGSQVAPGGGTHWVLLLQNALNPKTGIYWNDAFATGTNDAKLRDLFLCPDGPGAAEKNNLYSGVTYYECHPRLMPFRLGAAAHYGSGPAPYKISKVKRSAEIAAIWDASVFFDPTAKAWRVVNDTPVSTSLDTFGMNRPGNGGLFDDYADASRDPKVTADSSVYLTAYGSGTASGTASVQPAKWVNTDSPNNQHNIRFRHMRDTGANALMLDGHVESFRYNKSKLPNDPTVTNFKRKHVYINK